MGPATGCSAAGVPPRWAAPAKRTGLHAGQKSTKNRPWSSILVFSSVRLYGALAERCGAGLTSRHNDLAAPKEPLSPISSPRCAPRHKFPPGDFARGQSPEIPLPIGPEGDARAEAALPSLPGTDTQLPSPRSSANPPSLHIPFLKSWVM